MIIKTAIVYVYILNLDWIFWKQGW